MGERRAFEGGGISVDPSLDDLLSPQPVLQAALFCLQASRDEDDRLCLLGIFHTTLLEGGAEEFFLVNHWRYDDMESRSVREYLELRDPDGQVLGAIRTPEFDLGGDRRRHYSLIRFHKVRLTTPGTHEVRIQLLDAELELPIAWAIVPLMVE